MGRGGIGIGAAGEVGVVVDVGGDAKFLEGVTAAFDVEDVVFCDFGAGVFVFPCGFGEG